MSTETPSDWTTPEERGEVARLEDAQLLELLRTARGKLAAGWTQGCFAKDATGAQVNPEASEATCWCAVGAVRASMGPAYRIAMIDGRAHAELYEAIASVGAVDSGDAIVEFNDKAGRTQVEVLDLFDRAIAAVEARLAPEAGAPS